MSLTHKQRQLLTFIDDYTKRNDGIAPSFDEMMEALDLNSKNGPHRLLTALEERGFIRRIPNRARAIEVIRRPGEAARPDQSALSEYKLTLQLIAEGAGGIGPQAPIDYVRGLARKVLERFP